MPAARQAGGAQIDLCRTGPEILAEAVSGVDLVAKADWYQYAEIEDGSTYVSWRGIGGFVVSRLGDRVLWAPDPAAPAESVEVYLLGQALSFALVKAGLEPIHATAVEVDGQAIAFLGDSGFGKTTVAAGFIAAGLRLLTDDMLLLGPATPVMAFPGPPRIKLLPDSGHAFGIAPTGVRMNPFSEKMVIPLEERHVCRHPALLRAVYVIAPPSEVTPASNVCIEPLPPGEAFLALLQNTFNWQIDDAPRLRRQFREATRLVETVPVRRLKYPRVLTRLKELRAALMRDSGLQTPMDS
jgi:hypothetical protein